MSLLLLFNGARVSASDQVPSITLKALLIVGAPTAEGALIEAVAVPWYDILEMIERDPNSVYQLPWRTWEEVVAGAYTRAGFDEVILTPRSGDKGRDVIATRKGIGSIRIFDQVKAYSPGHLVPADEVRAMAGVLSTAGNVSKGVVTTTSTFAPGIVEDEYIKTLIPFRLELKPRDVLLSWLAALRAKKSA